MSLAEDPELLGYWRYFLLLEAELDNILRYIDPDPRNRHTFSLELARQLLSVCAQFEVIARLLAGPSAARARSLPAVYKALAPTAPGLNGWGVTFLPRNERIFPFTDWGPTSGPRWWSAYNSIKHRPLAHPEAATLANLIPALGGLGLLTTRYLRHETGSWLPRLFDLNYG